MRGRPKQYDWDELFTPTDSDSYEFTLTRGVDYDCASGSLARYMRMQATARRLHPRIHQTDDNITVVVSS